MLKLPVAILGATGIVGQKACALLANHPQFFVSEVAASPKNEGKLLRQAIRCYEEDSLPEEILSLTLKSFDQIKSPYVISALPKEIALDIEPFLTKRGHHVFSNASAYRMDPDVPLLIPEVNPSHISLIERQKTEGKLIANPNCSTVFISLALFPLFSLGMVQNVSVFTMQAVSGAGYPGVSSLDVLGNVIPFIPGEEEKICRETKKILGKETIPAAFSLTANCHRLPVLHGHTCCLHVQFSNEISLISVVDAYQKQNVRYPRLYKIYKEPNLPQPKLLKSDDQSVHIGRIKRGDTSNVLSLVVLGHNLVRGAAGAAIKNMELTHNFLKESRCVSKV